MPDWLTHLVIAAVSAEIVNTRKKSLVLLGAILPDLLPKLMLLRLFIQLPNIDYSVLSAFHTPFVLFLVICLMTLLFKYDYIKVVALLSLGAGTHFVADTLLIHFTGGVHLLYPFSLHPFRFDLFWPDQPWAVLLPMMLIYVLIMLIKWKKKRKEVNNSLPASSC